MGARKSDFFVKEKRFKCLSLTHNESGQGCRAAENRKKKLVPPFDDDDGNGDGDGENVL